MGKFDGVLLVSDYDDTLYNHHCTVSAENHAALDYFMDHGGRFSIATGRAWRTFTPQIRREQLRFNAPVVLSNGAAVFDYETNRYLIRTQLDEDIKDRILDLCGAFPDLGLEAYHGEEIYIHNPNTVTHRHLQRMGVPYNHIPLSEVPTPWVKVLLQQDHPYLMQVQEYILTHWNGSCEAIFSNPFLLEITAKNANKGTMVAAIADSLKIHRKHLYCVGDNMNDVPMLALSAIPFAPGNCSQGVKDFGARVLKHCNEHTVAQVVEILDTLY